MKVHIVPSSVGETSRQQILATYIINDTVAIDAGSLGLLTPVAAQRRVKHVFLSHSHLDHVATLPIFIDNVYEPGPNCPTVWANGHVAEMLQKDLFNDRLWPDMIRLSGEESPFLRMKELQSELPVDVEGLRITPLPLNHVVPAFGFLIEECVTGASVLFVSDTGPSDRIWEVANQAARLQAVFLEASFPNSFRWLAEKAAHLTPELFAAELAKLNRPVPTYVIHIKVAFESQIISELNDLGLPHLIIGEPGSVLEFS